MDWRRWRRAVSPCRCCWRKSALRHWAMSSRLCRPRRPSMSQARPCWTGSRDSNCIGAFWPWAKSPSRCRWTKCWRISGRRTCSSWLAGSATTTMSAACSGTPPRSALRRCCLIRPAATPFYRKAIRVSVSAVLRTPFVVAGATDIIEALQRAGVEVLALTPSATERLSDYRRAGPVALMLGSEGPGLPKDLIDRCRPIGIAMAGGFDSLNVAATSAVALHHLTTTALTGS